MWNEGETVRKLLSFFALSLFCDYLLLPSLALSDCYAREWNTGRQLRIIIILLAKIEFEEELTITPSIYLKFDCRVREKDRGLLLFLNAKPLFVLSLSLSLSSLSVTSC